MDWSLMISFEGVALCASGALFYLLGESCDRHPDELKSAIRLDKLKDLAQLVNVASKVVPLVVAVSGWIGSDNPIKCKYINARGVIMDKREEHRFLKRNDKGEWREESTLVHSHCEEVPWYLGDATGRVCVPGGRWASGLVLSYGGGVFEESKESPDSKKLEEQGLKCRCLEFKKYEHVLPTGASLMVIGEAFKDRSEAIAIAQSSKGPFYVSYQTVDKLIATQETYSELCKYASISLTVVWVCLLAKRASEYTWRRASEYIRRRRLLQERRRLQETQERFLAAVDDPVEMGSNDRTEDASDVTNEDRRKTDTCMICFQQEYNSVFVPCGHMCCCIACSIPLIRCPICRAQIKQVVRTYRT